MKNKFKIRFTGGLGDCLKMITEQTSLYQYYLDKGLHIYWVYSDMNIVDIVYKQFRGSKICNNQWSYIRDYDKHIDYNNSNLKTISGAYPVHQALYDFLKHFSFFELTEQETFANMDDAIELENYRCHRYPNFSLNNQLKGLYEYENGGWKINLNDLYIDSLLNNSKHTFCFQLSGSNAAKKYDVENYIKIFKMILDRYPSCKILLIDRPNYFVDTSLLFDERIINLIGKISIIQCAKIIQEVDYLICPDSYSKYLRKWVNKKQIILCNRLLEHPDLRKVLHDAFNIVGLCNNPDITLLGITYTMNNKNRDTSDCFDSVEIVNSMNDISPEEIFNSIKL